ncbi:MAG TPA: methyltransferase domain-containing protein [Candidatus Latescibacteria bacterium]|jgi:SAM-dependent methyltransferase|nr:hypothetical protein [Gemmatimonadaceae bacterium]MDP6016819.1 methyltransferase domain-containing protein [Candidatus Latescibacterota bacterium]HJP32260.1 methyltransferase domain-containing protein [Candidatus Latescibacterota bacterium]
MNRAYWDGLASGFQHDVLQVSECDTGEVIAATARSLRGRSKRAIDFGCGPGAVTRAIAPFFGTTVGVDYAPKLLQEARRLSADTDILYEQRNLERPPDPAWARADVGFCVNVLIHERAELRQHIAAHVCSSVRPGGAIVVVVPSLESTLRTYQALLRCHEREGRSHARARGALDRQSTTEIHSLTDGIVNVGGTLTKHFLQDEIAQFLHDHGCDVTRISRVEYPWQEELDDAPAWLGPLTPWDWLVRGTIR